ncbi:MAG: hypothetical protein ABR569_05630 [Gaiellaceae bacterium]
MISPHHRRAVAEASAARLLGDQKGRERCAALYDVAELRASSSAERRDAGASNHITLLERRVHALEREAAEKLVDPLLVGLRAPKYWTTPIFAVENPSPRRRVGRTSKAMRQRVSAPGSLRG